MKPQRPAPTRGEPARGVRAELLARGLEPKRTLGQNFLADMGLCEKIARLICPEGNGSVLEIGAGLGAITSPLLDAGCRVVAVETDRELASALRAKLAAELGSGQLTLLEADARTLDLGEVLDAMPAPRTLAGNLPYHLSGLLLRRAVDVSARLARSVFLLQLEVVDRMCAAPAEEAYGALSIFTQAVYAPRRSMVVRRGAFYPQPSVDSAVVVLERLAQPVAVSDEFSKLVRAAFEKRRKTLRNAWRDTFGWEGTQLQALASAASVDLNARGETLAVSDFDRMAQQVRAHADQLQKRGDGS